MSSLEMTKGAYLKEKLSNMARWVVAEVGKENLPVDIVAGIDGRSELEVTMLAAVLQSNTNVSTLRNWDEIQQLVTTNNLPSELGTVVALIRDKESMHDKFWRYIELFSEVAAQ